MMILTLLLYNIIISIIRDLLSNMIRLLTTHYIIAGAYY